MFAYLKGILIQASPVEVVIEIHGIGYQLQVPANLFGKLPQVGASVTLYTSYIVREQSQTLFGFLTVNDKLLFELLLSVTGIGPKLALSMIGHLNVVELQQAILSRDLLVLSKVPGIGKKTAERLVIELRDKIMTLSSIPQSDVAFSIKDAAQTQKIRDAMNALINLGYNQQAAQKAIKKTLESHSEEIDLAVLITSSLKNF